MLTDRQQKIPEAFYLLLQTGTPRWCFCSLQIHRQQVTLWWVSSCTLTNNQTQLTLLACHWTALKRSCALHRDLPGSRTVNSTTASAGMDFLCKKCYMPSWYDIITCTTHRAGWTALPGLMLCARYLINAHLPFTTSGSASRLSSSSCPLPYSHISNSMPDSSETHAWGLQGGLQTRKLKIALSTTAEKIPLCGCCSEHRQRSCLRESHTPKMKG